MKGLLSYICVAFACILNLTTAQQIGVETVVVDTNDPTCFRPPIVVNAVRNPPVNPDLQNDRYTVGLQLTYDCITGYTNVGSPTARCENRVWVVSERGDPRCAPIQRPPTCTPNICRPNSQCVVQNNRIACPCVTGYVERGSFCIAIQRPPTCTPGSCRPNSQCVVQNNAITCPCVAGYVQRGSICIARQSCSTPGICPANSQCTEVGNGIVCNCLESYVQVGRTCVVVRSCETAGICPLNSQCIQNGNDITCRCNADFIQVGQVCQARPTPAMCTAVSCRDQPNTSCRVIRGEITCPCNMGYTRRGRGRLCEAICGPNTCQIPNSRCEVFRNRPRCRCVEGYEPIGQACERIRPIPTCDGNPCGPNSVCRVIGRELSCTCVFGYTREDSRCEPICGQNTCPMNSECIVRRNQPICRCVRGFENRGGVCQVITTRSPITPTPRPGPVCTLPCPDPNSACTIYEGRQLCICRPGYVNDRGTCRPRRLLSSTPGRCNDVCVPNSVCEIFEDGTESVCACTPGYFLYYLAIPNTCRPRPGRPTEAPVTACQLPTIGSRPNLIIVNQGPVRIGGILIFRCAANFFIEGNSRLSCRPGGAYSPATLPRCRPRTVITTPPRPPVTPRPFVCTPRCTDPNSRCVVYRGTPLCICNVGYVNDRLRCRPRGQLNPTLGQCNDRCRNTNSVCERFEDGTESVCACVPGYFLYYGAVPNTCEPRPSQPTCQAPPLPGNLRIINVGPIAVGAVLRFACPANYILQGVGSPITCLQGGRYSSNFFPSCVPVITTTPQPPVISCVAPGISSGSQLTIVTGQRSYAVGEVIQYGCRDLNYVIIGSRRARCLNTGQFMNPVPSCRFLGTTPSPPTAPPAPGRTCIIPIAPRNGFFQPQRATWVVGDTVTYGCNNGFVLNGNPTATCVVGGTYTSFPPTCDPSAMCPPPYVPQGAMIKPFVSVDISPGRVITYSCEAGRSVIGGVTRITCMPNGAYDNPFPACTNLVGVPVTPFSTISVPTTPTTPRIVTLPSFPCAVDNLRPFLPTNAFIVNELPNYSSGQNGTFACSSPYVIIPETENSFVCNPDGTFTVGQAFCAQIELPSVESTSVATTAPPFSPPAPAVSCSATDVLLALNSNFVLIQGDQTSWQPGENGTFYCRNDSNGEVFFIGRTNVFQCDINGNVIVPEGPPYCLLTITCPRPAAPVNGQILTSQERYEVGGFLLYNCLAGYNLVGSESVVCQTDGSFSGDPPVCVSTTPTVCSVPAPPTFGRITNPQSEYRPGDVITFTCNIGLELSGNPSATCQDDGSFSSNPPTCIAAITRVTCTVNPPFGGAIVNATSTIRAGEFASFVCTLPFRRLIGSSRILCLANGSLASPTPECTVCSPDPPVNGLIIPVTKVTWGPGEIVNYQCLPGFQFSENSIPINFCENDGELVTPVPVCERAADLPSVPEGCPDLPPTNGRITGVQTLSNTSAIITYGCSDNYTLEGSSTLLCADGVLTPPNVPICLSELSDEG